VIRIILPAHLRTLANVSSEVEVALDGPATIAAVVDALETEYPVLRGRIRDTHTHQRRPFVRYFACEEDISHEPPDTQLPDRVVEGAEPFQIIGAMAGG
jgi:sulfur-carrier protein